MRCFHCGGRFGLARRIGYYINRYWVYERHFCKRSCKEVYDTQLQHKLKAQQYHRWLCS